MTDDSNAFTVTVRLDAVLAGPGWKRAQQAEVTTSRPRAAPSSITIEQSDFVADFERLRWSDNQPNLVDDDEHQSMPAPVDPLDGWGLGDEWFIEQHVRGLDELLVDRATGRGTSTLTGEPHVWRKSWEELIGQVGRRRRNAGRRGPAPRSILENIPGAVFRVLAADGPGEIYLRAGLSRREQEAIEHDLDGLSDTVIADYMGIDPGAVKATLFRARAKLRRLPKRAA